MVRSRGEGFSLFAFSLTGRKTEDWSKRSHNPSTLNWREKLYSSVNRSAKSFIRHAHALF